MIRSAAEERAVGKSSSASAAAGKQRLASDKAPQQAHKAGPGPVMGLGVPDPKPQHHHQGGQQHPGGGAGASSSSSKPAPKLELPRIYTTLSRKEKEEDFLAMKGTKLPQRPKRRPKNVEKAVNVRAAALLPPPACSPDPAQGLANPWIKLT
jgi:hypothetical protein